jgi:LmbE family N-acetylglucosaminyl deacetylase
MTIIRQARVDGAIVRTRLALCQGERRERPPGAAVTVLARAHHRCYSRSVARSLTAATLALALVVAVATPAPADVPRASVAVLMDLSYSLRLREGGVRRIDLLRDAVSVLVEARGIEWALLSFRDVGDYVVDVPFTDDSARLRAALPRLPGGRLSPVREAVGWAGEYLVDHARADRRAVVLVSDGIGTGGASFAATVGKGYADEGIALFVLGVEHGDNPVIRETLDAVARETGGGYYPYHHVADLARALARLQPRRVAGAPVARRLAQIGPGAPPPAASGAGPARRVHLWLLGAGLVGLALFVAVRFRWLRQDSRRTTARRTRVILSLGVFRPDGSRETLAFERPPVTVGGGADARIPIPRAGRTNVSIIWDRQTAHLESAVPVIVNGVATRRKVLKPNDRIALAGTRIAMLGLAVRHEEAEPAPTRADLTPLVAVSGVLIVLGIIFAAVRAMSMFEYAALARAATLTAAAGDGGVPLAGTVRPQSVPRRGVVDANVDALRHEVPRPQVSPPAPAAAPTPAQPAAASAPAATPAAQPRLAPPPVAPPLPAPQRPAAAADAVAAVAARAAFLAPADERKVPRGLLARVAPGEPVPFFDADIVFFHAHPDDESLDFAGLMSLAARRGLKTAVVLFTDGESGIDQYPDRPTGGRYRGSTLSGTDLAAARVDEAGKALEILGATMYVRLGLRNHPYNTSNDELRLERILASWGGETKLVSRVVELIQGFRPEIVVSSDFNETAYEHFEHKAVGWVVAAALQRLHGTSAAVAARKPRGGYLVSVDPFQGPLYGDLLRLDLMGKDPASGLSYREVQMAALKEHLTQADASLLGVEFLPNFRYEQYHPVYWNLPSTLPDLLAGR